MRMLVDTIRQHAALIKAHIAREGRQSDGKQRVFPCIRTCQNAAVLRPEYRPIVWRLRFSRHRLAPRTGRFPIGFSGSRRPARASLIAELSVSMALSCPKTTRFSDALQVFQQPQHRLLTRFLVECARFLQRRFDFFCADGFATSSRPEPNAVPRRLHRSHRLPESGSLRSLM